MDDLNLRMITISFRICMKIAQSLLLSRDGVVVMVVRSLFASKLLKPNDYTMYNFHSILVELHSEKHIWTFSTNITLEPQSEIEHHALFEINIYRFIFALKVHCHEMVKYYYL